MPEQTTRAEQEDNIYQNTFKKPSGFSEGFLFLDYEIASVKNSENTEPDLTIT